MTPHAPGLWEWPSRPRFRLIAAETAAPTRLPRKQSCAAVDRGNWCRFPHRRAGPFLCAHKEMDERKPLRSRGRYATSLAPCCAAGSGREAVPRLTAGTRTSCPRPFGPALLATAHRHAPTGSKNLPKPCGFIECCTLHKPISMSLFPALPIKQAG